MSHLAIEIGGSKLQIVAGDGRGLISRRLRFNVDPSQGGEGIRRQIAGALPPLVREFDARSLAVGFGGPVDRAAGRVHTSHQIEGWSEFALRSWLSDIATIPVTIENDANCAALGEYHAERRAAASQASSDPLFYMTLGSGVGAGLVTAGRIYHGAPPGECEFGHLRLDRAGATVESECSGWAINRKIQQLIPQHPDSPLVRLAQSNPGHEARHLSAALEANDPLAHSVITTLAHDLAFALSHAVHLFHPRTIVIGGGLSLLGSPLLNAVAHFLPQYIMPAFHPIPTLRLALLGEEAVPCGALILARELLEP
jgi:glucokinase